MDNTVRIPVEEIKASNKHDICTISTEESNKIRTPSLIKSCFFENEATVSDPCRLAIKKTSKIIDDALEIASGSGTSHYDDDDRWPTSTSGTPYSNDSLGDDDKGDKGEEWTIPVQSGMCTPRTGSLYSDPSRDKQELLFDNMASFETMMAAYRNGDDKVSESSDEDDELCTACTKNCN